MQIFYNTTSLGWLDIIIRMAKSKSHADDLVLGFYTAGLCQGRRKGILCLSGIFLCCLIFFLFCILLFTSSWVVLLKQLEEPTTEKKSFIRREVKFIPYVSAMSGKFSVPSLEEMFIDQSSCLHIWTRNHIIEYFTISDAT